MLLPLSSLSLLPKSRFHSQLSRPFSSVRQAGSMLLSSSVPASSAARISSGVSRMVPSSVFTGRAASSEFVSAPASGWASAACSTGALRGSSAASASVSCCKLGKLFSCSSSSMLPIMGSAGAASGAAGDAAVSSAGAAGASDTAGASVSFWLGAAGCAADAAVLSASEDAESVFDGLGASFLSSFFVLWAALLSPSHSRADGSTVKPAG